WKPAKPNDWISYGSNGLHGFRIRVIRGYPYELQPSILATGKPIGQSIEHVETVGIGDTVIAIMQQNDIAGFRLLNSARNVKCRLDRPIACGDRPHYGLTETHFSHYRLKLGSAEAKRRTNDRHYLAGGSPNRVFTTPQFINDLPL